MGVENKRYTLDRDLPITSLDHLIRDYKQGPKLSRLPYYEEYVRLVDKFPEAEVVERMQHLLDIDYIIHCHVSTGDTFREFLEYCQKNLLLGLEMTIFLDNFHKLIYILRKTTLA